MQESIAHPAEMASNAERASISSFEPKSSRTFTPSLAVIARSAGVFHWTPEGRKLYDFTSGVLVANLGHNPTEWTKRFFNYMGWTEGSDGPFVPSPLQNGHASQSIPSGFFPGVPYTAYNAVTIIETEACKRLLALMRRSTRGTRFNQVLWAASGSEAVQKALWAAMSRDKSRNMILATRWGFHGKKGLAGATTGTENDPERDPRVKFISFPMDYNDISQRNKPFDPEPYIRELEAAKQQYGRRFCALITEPYLGGGGSYHPPKQYLQLLQNFCRENDIVFILDEVQANFGRCGTMFAYEKYDIEPDMVVLGKGLGNGVPVAAVVGRKDLFAKMDYGEGSDTWSANPLSCASVLATIDEFEAHNLIPHTNHVSKIIEEGLIQLKELPFIGYVRGEEGGMVWGVETKEYDGRTAQEWANLVVLAGYRGNGVEGIHLLGPLAKKVVRISPPLVITEQQAKESVALLKKFLFNLVEKKESAPPTGSGSFSRVPVVAPANQS